MKPVAVAAAVTVAVMLTGCSTTSSSPTPSTSSSSSTSLPTPTQSASPTTTNPSGDGTVVTGGSWKWRETGPVTFKLQTGAVVVVEDAKGASGVIDDMQVASFTGEDPVTITALRAGATSGYIQLGEEKVSFTVFVDGPQDAASTTAAEIVGMKEKKAKATVEDAGYVWRVVSRDGEDLPVTMDYFNDRINASIVDGIVTGATTG